MFGRGAKNRYGINTNPADSNNLIDMGSQMSLLRMAIDLLNRLRDGNKQSDKFFGY